MTRIYDIRTNFTSGEISTDMFGRTDLVAYNNGAMCMKNVFIAPMGGVKRRAGLRHMSRAPAGGRLVEFSYSTEQCYLLLFHHLKLSIYKEGELVAELDTPWGDGELPSIRWTQNSDTLFVVHHEVPPRSISRNKDMEWSIGEWEFEEVDGAIRQPYYKFDKPSATVKPSDISGNAITLTASDDIFKEGHVGVRWRINGGEVEITAVHSPRLAVAKGHCSIKNTQATKEYGEAAFSGVRGWPMSATFHQDRLVIGGSHSLPNRLWFSQISRFMNFSLGEGLDDEAIEFNILSDQANTICALFSGKHLQVFTTGAEWMVEGKPLTPANIQITRQTKVGSQVSRYIQPCYIDGSTVFVSANGVELKEFVFTDLEQAYQAHDLSTLSRHLVRNPVDQDYNSLNRILYIVMQDGTLATVTNYRAEGVTAWSWHLTQGKFLSVAVVGTGTYVLVERNGGVFIEKFDSEYHTDSGFMMESESPAAVWEGLEHLEGMAVKVASENGIEGEYVVGNGRITLLHPVRQVEIGLGFEHEISGLPPIISLGNVNTIPGSYRLVRSTFRIVDSQQLVLEVGGRSISAMPKRISHGCFDNGNPQYCGDIEVRSLGWSHNPTEPVWKIKGDDPADLHIISVLTEINVKE